MYERTCQFIVYIPKKQEVLKTLMCLTIRNTFIKNYVQHDKIEIKIMYVKINGRFQNFNISHNISYM